MKKGFLYFLLLFILQTNFAQTSSWTGYFSFNDINDLTTSSTKVYAASENALFEKNLATSELETTNTVDGLSGKTISAVYHSATSNKTIVGYENGLLIVINEADGTMKNVVDIVNKNITSSSKNINHFMEYDGIIYISCDFGVIQYNLSTLLFGDTFYIGDNGDEISVTQTTVLDGYIYASTSTGIRRANVSSKFLVDYSQWSLITSGSWSSIEAFGTNVYAINTSGYVYKYNSSTNTFDSYMQLSETSLDMRATDDYLIITTSSTVSIYSSQMTLVRQITTSQISDATVTFSCATAVGDDIYIGTAENGVYSTSTSSSSSFENLLPSGPSKNNMFAIQTTTTGSLWAAYGDYGVYYNPYPLDSYGISKYSSTSGWLNIPYEDVLEAKSLVRVIVNPTKESEVYIGSSYSGLLKVVDNTPTTLYNEDNSGLEDITFISNYSDDVRINGGAFDSSGNLWVNNSLVENGIKVLKSNGDWESYSTKSILDDYETCSFGRMTIDDNGTKWIATYTDGVIGFNESGSVYKKITSGSDTGNLPSADARIAVPDNDNQLWIGTSKGLRVLSSIYDFDTDDQLTTDSIIFSEDGVAEELLYEQFITDIVVDGANCKWIGTVDSGVFYVSSDGETTKNHFTSSNSPLPSNVINDIDINSTTGEVFIATDKGLVSYAGTATSASDNLSNVYVYPNPVRPDFSGTVKIAGLIDQATIKITDIEGNLVYETTSEGGTVEWDRKAFGKYYVASGVYMVFISSEDGTETKVKKIMVIR
jgi:hypothetical protein